jgi:hypothetical protein
MAAVAMQMLRPPSQIVIAGRRGEASTEALWHECNRRFLPGTARIHVDPAEQTRLAEIIPYAGQVLQAGESATAFLCSNFVCQLPVSDPRDVGTILDTSHPVSPGQLDV